MSNTERLPTASTTPLENLRETANAIKSLATVLERESDNHSMGSMLRVYACRQLSAIDALAEERK